MQTRDGVSDNIAPQYSGPGIESGLARPFPASRRILAVVAAWLIPGAGHMVLGRFGRGLLFLIVIVGAFVLGLALNGRLYWPMPAESASFLPYDMITILWTFAQIGSGLCYMVSYTLGFGAVPHPEASTYEYGNTFMFLAGLLNYLVIHDAFDIGLGRKH